MGNCMHIGHACPPHHHNNKNISSCTASPQYSSIKVLHPSDGRISEFCQQSLKAAELMLEFPNQFLVELQKGNHRPSPLSADTDLKPCHAYLLLPMHRISARISQEEMACYTSALSHHHHNADSPAAVSKSRRPKSSILYGQRKVTPLTDDHDEDADGHDHGSHHSEGSETSFVNIQKSYSYPLTSQELRDATVTVAAPSRSRGVRNSMNIVRSRSWVPKLETISESGW